MLKSLKRQVESLLWHPSLPRVRPLLNWVTRFARYPYALLRDALEGQLTLRAMGLVYTTLLSLVPLLALSFSLLKAFGIHNQLEPTLNNLLLPLGPRSAELTTNIIGFVDNVRGIALGSAGLVLLIYTVVSMVQKVEESFNYVWQVERSRSFGKRFSEYLSVILIAPILMLAAVFITGTIANTSIVQALLAMEPLGTTLLKLGKFTPHLLVTIAFTFVYGFIPNTKVKISAAIVGGLTAGIMWATVGALFAAFVAGSTKYTAIYSGFAVAMVALFWLYISWLILLLGAKIAFYFQHPEYLRHGRRRVSLTNRLRERLALVVMHLVAENYCSGDARWSLNDLARWVGLPSQSLAPVVRELEKAGLLVATEKESFVPGRDLDSISVADILAAIRGDSAADLRTGVRASAQVDSLMTGVDDAIDTYASSHDLREMLKVDLDPDDEVAAAARRKAL